VTAGKPVYNAAEDFAANPYRAFLRRVPSIGRRPADDDLPAEKRGLQLRSLLNGNI
jgi:hypothetical protein